MHLCLYKKTQGPGTGRALPCLPEGLLSKEEQIQAKPHCLPPPPPLSFLCMLLISYLLMSNKSLSIHQATLPFIGLNHRCRSPSVCPQACCGLSCAWLCYGTGCECGSGTQVYQCLCLTHACSPLPTADFTPSTVRKSLCFPRYLPVTSML